MKIPLSNLHIYRCDRHGTPITTTPHYSDVSAPTIASEQMSAPRDQWQRKQSVRDRFKWQWTRKLGFAMTVNVPNPLRAQVPPGLSIVQQHQEEQLQSREMPQTSSPRAQETRSSEGASSPLGTGSGQDVNRAARTIVRAMRYGTARSVYDRLKHPIDDDKRELTVPMLSRRNLSRLRKELSPLTEQETSFVTHLLGAKFFATHATSQPAFDEDGSVTLFSRKKLEGKNIEFNKNHTAHDDLTELRNDDFVFFNLEAGLQLQKKESRFGSKLLRFDFTAPVFKETAWLSGADLMQLYPPGIQRHIDGLDQADRDALNRRYIKDESLVFQGKDMLIGLALSIVRDCRTISEAGRARILSATTDEEINAVVNGMYRPEVKVPRHFFAKPYDVTDIRYVPNKLLA